MLSLTLAVATSTTRLATMSFASLSTSFMKSAPLYEISCKSRTRSSTHSFKCLLFFILFQLALIVSSPVIDSASTDLWLPCELSLSSTPFGEHLWASLPRLISCAKFRHCMEFYRGVQSGFHKRAVRLHHEDAPYHPPLCQCLPKKPQSDSATLTKNHSDGLCNIRSVLWIAFRASGATATFLSSFVLTHDADVLEIGFQQSNHWLTAQTVVEEALRGAVLFVSVSSTSCLFSNHSTVTARHYHIILLELLFQLLQLLLSLLHFGDVAISSIDGPIHMFCGSTHGVFIFVQLLLNLLSHRSHVHDLIAHTGPRQKETWLRPTSDRIPFSC